MTRRRLRPQEIKKTENLYNLKFNVKWNIQQDGRSWIIFNNKTSVGLSYCKACHTIFKIDTQNKGKYEMECDGWNVSLETGEIHNS